MTARIVAAILISASPLAAQLAGPRAQSPGARRAPASSRPASPPASSTRDTKYPPMAPIEFPKAELTTLPNGLRIYLLEDHELPVVQGAALVRTGRAFEPADKLGVGSVTTQLMRTGGAGGRLAGQIDDDLAIYGARVDSRMGETSATVSFQALKETAGPVLEIFRDILTNPALTIDQLDQVKAEAGAVIAARNNNPGVVARRELTRAIFGAGSPLGRREERNTISAIRRTDVQAFYKRYFFPRNTMIAIWGDFDAGAMKEDINKLFAAWNADQPAVPAFPEAHPVEPVTLLAARKDLKQVVFAMGLAGSRINDKDYAALDVAAAILGRGDQSRIARKLQGRTEFGEAGSASGAWGGDLMVPGVFQITGTLPTFQSVAFLKTIKEEAARLGTADVTDDELALAKNTLLTAYAFDFDTRAKAMTNMLAYEYAGYPKDFPKQLQQSYAAVTKADIQRVAKAYIDPAKFTLVVLGSPTQMADPLDSLGRAVTPLDLTIPELTVKSATDSAEAVADGKRILAAAQQAAGGLQALLAAKDYTELSEVRIEAAFGGGVVKQKVQWLTPASFRQEQDMPIGTLVAYTDGDVGWIANKQASAALGGSELKQVRGNLFRCYIPLLLSDQAAGRKILAADDNSIDISDALGNAVHIDFDDQTHLLHRLIFSMPATTGGMQTMVETYSDYHDVNGIRIPFKVSSTQGGRKYGEGVTSQVKLNQGLKAEEMRKRP